MSNKKLKVGDKVIYIYKDSPYFEYKEKLTISSIKGNFHPVIYFKESEHFTFKKKIELIKSNRIKKL